MVCFSESKWYRRADLDADDPFWTEHMGAAFQTVAQDVDKALQGGASYDVGSWARRKLAHGARQGRAPRTASAAAERRWTQAAESRDRK